MKIARTPALVIIAMTSAAPLFAQDSAVEHVEVSGTSFPYTKSGEGEPVLFVHGAFADHRVWEPMRETVAQDHRFLAYTQRQFGTGDWTETPGYDRDAHAADLAALLDAWGEPMQIVGWSYSGPVVLQAAIDRPELVESVVLYEPSHPELVAAQPDGGEILQEFGSGFAPAAGAIEQGDLDQALRLSLEYVLSLEDGFESLPELNQTVALDNAHTVPMQFGMPAPTPLTCEDLGRIEAPVLVLLGSETLPFFEAAANAVAGCLPNAEIRVIQGAAHGGPVSHWNAVLDQALGFIDDAGAS